MAVAAPVQVHTNGDMVKIYWDPDTTGAYASYNLYYDATNPAMGAEVLLKASIPNVTDGMYSTKHVMYTFDRRPLVGLAADASFYVRVKGVSAGGVIDIVGVQAAGAYIPNVYEVSPDRRNMMYGWDPTTNTWRPIKVTKDATTIAGQMDVV